MILLRHHGARMVLLRHHGARMVLLRHHGARMVLLRHHGARMVLLRHHGARMVLLRHHGARQTASLSSRLRGRRLPVSLPARARQDLNVDPPRPCTSTRLQLPSTRVSTQWHCGRHRDEAQLSRRLL